MEIQLLLEKYKRCDDDATSAELLAELEENFFDTFPQLLLSLLSHNNPAEDTEVTKRLLLLCSASLNPKELFLLLEQHSSPFFASVSERDFSSAVKFFVDLLLRGKHRKTKPSVLSLALICSPLFHFLTNSTTSVGIDPRQESK